MIQVLKCFTISVILLASLNTVVFSAEKNGSTPIKFYGDTNRPELNMFIKGEDVTLLFRVENIPSSTTKLCLTMKIIDIDEKTVKSLNLPVVPDKNGRWKASVKVPSDRLGFYRVYAALSNGLKMRQQGSLPPEFLTYGVTFGPSERRLCLLENTYFGMQGRPERNVASAPFLGIRWHLGPHRWQWTEPDYPGQFRDTVLKRKKEGKPPLSNTELYTYTLSGKKETWQQYPVFRILGGNRCLPTKWKVSLYEKGPKEGWGILTKEGEKHFADYCRHFARAVAQSFPEIEKHYYEVIWEPEIHFQGKPEDIVRYLEIAYPIIHEEDVNAVVLGPNIAGAYTETLVRTKEYLEKGMGKYIDLYSFHPYVRYPPEKNNLISFIQDLKKVIREGAGRDIPIAGTECGKSSSGARLKRETLNAKCLTRQNLIMLGEGFVFNLSFFGVDNTQRYQSDSYGIFYNLDKKRKYLPRKICPKPHALYYAAMTYLLEGYKGVKTIDWLGGSSWGYAYENRTDKRDVTLALWDYGDAPRTVSILAGVGKVVVYDSMGNEKEVNTSNGVLSVELDGKPLYIKGVSPRIWGSEALQALAFEKAGAVELFPGEKAQFNVSVAASGKERLSAEVVADCREGFSVVLSSKNIELSAGDTSRVQVLVKLQEKIKPGIYPVLIMLQKDGKTLDAISRNINVKPPVGIGDIKPLVDANGQTFVQFELSELQGREASAKAEFTINAARKRYSAMDFSIAPGQKKIFKIKCDARSLDPAIKYSATFQLSLKSGYVLKRNLSVNFLSVKNPKDTIVVDGSPRDWASIPAIELKGKKYCVRNHFDYSGDSAELKFAWDSECFYLLAVVRDDVFIQDEMGSITWKDDCLQCGFSLEPWKKEIVTGNTLADEANKPMQTEIELALTKRGPQAYRNRCIPKRDGWTKGLLNDKDCRLAVVRTGNNITYEAAFAWHSLGLKSAPEKGSHIGIAIAVNDRDRTEGDAKGVKVHQITRLSAISLFDGATDKKDRNLMGLIQFE